MLNEVALTPDVFDGALYSSQDACDIHLRYIREPLLTEVLVRDLRDGAWSAHIGQTEGRWHLRGKELFRKLAAQSRLRRFRPSAVPDPQDDDQWCDEAVASSQLESVAAIISSNAVAANHSSCPTVCSVERATNSAWWQGRSPSRQVPRKINAFMDALRLVLPNANSLMFIDPHLDPSQPRYGNFIQLLLAARRDPPALLEVHRACYEGSGPKRIIFTGDGKADLEKRFRDNWSAHLVHAGIKVAIYVWPDIHDRSLITNLIGIELSNGFDESNVQGDTVKLLRLGRADADAIQRKFDKAVNRPHYIIQLP